MRPGPRALTILVGVLLGLSCEVTPIPDRPPDLVSDGGSRLWFETNESIDGGYRDPTEATVSAQEGYLLTGLTDHASYDLSKSRKCVTGFKVVVKGVPFWGEPSALLEGGGDQVYGVEWLNSATIGVADPPCCNSYVHELTHWLQYCVRGDVDFWHTDTDVWQTSIQWNDHCSDYCSTMGIH